MDVAEHATRNVESCFSLLRYSFRVFKDIFCNSTQLDPFVFFFGSQTQQKIAGNRIKSGLNFFRFSFSFENLPPKMFRNFEVIFSPKKCSFRGNKIRIAS